MLLKQVEVFQNGTLKLIIGEVSGFQEHARLELHLNQIPVIIKQAIINNILPFELLLAIFLFEIERDLALLLNVFKCQFYFRVFFDQVPNCYKEQ